MCIRDRAWTSRSHRTTPRCMSRSAARGRDREPGGEHSMRRSIHWLLIAVPLAIALKALGAGAPLLFFCAALAIVPLAVLIVHSTEHLATYTGPALGGLL